MIIRLLSILLSLGQAQLTDAGPGWIGNPNLRHIPLPGTIEPNLKPISGFSCRRFVAYNEVQTVMNVAQGGDTSCSGELLDQRTGSFRQINYLSTPSGTLLVVIHSPAARVDANSRVVILLIGGPRNVAISTPLAKRLVARGYTVLMPLYLGEIETRHPDPDLPGAITQIQALEKWARGRLIGTIGISAGGYLAAASCKRHCAPRVLLAPPLTTPEDVYTDQRVDWSKTTKEVCLWRQGGSERLCLDEKPFMRSFWDEDHYLTSLTDLLKGRCARTRIVVSPDDKRVYDPSGVANLRAAGCVVETPAGYEHRQMDGSPELNDHTIDLIAWLHQVSRSRE